MAHSRRVLVAATAALLLLIPQADDLLLSGSWGVGYAVCHQIPSHTIFMDGRQLPLCARCTGLYLGFLIGLLGMALLGKARASRLPPASVGAVLVVVLAAMAVDGFNSLLGFFPDAPQAYQPTNFLRLATGMSAGASLALLLMPLLNDLLWARPLRSESVSDLGELAGYGVLVAMGVLVVDSAQPILFYPVAFLSTLGVLVALSAAAATVAATALRRERQARTLRETSPLLAGGFALAAFAMLATGAARAYLSPVLGL